MFTSEQTRAAWSRADMRPLVGVVVVMFILVSQKKKHPFLGGLVFVMVADSD